MIRSGAWSDLQNSLFSSVFRRGIRLYFPSFAGLLIMRIFWYAGWRTEDDPEVLASSKGFVIDQIRQMIYLIEPFRFEGGRGWVHQLWTIPVSIHWV
jgi:hypothetical protein